MGAACGHDGGVALGDAMARTHAIAREQVERMGYDYDELIAQCGAGMPWYAAAGDFRDSNGILIDCKTNMPKESLYVADDGSDALFPIFTREQALENARRRRERVESEGERRRRMQANVKRCFGAEFADFAGCSLANETDEVIFSQARQYLADFRRYRSKGRGLVFVGPASTGKTHMAAWVANALLQDGHRGVMVSELGLIDGMRERGGTRPALQELVDNDFVVVDALFKSHDMNRAFRIVDALYSRGIPMIATVCAEPSVFADAGRGDEAAVVDRIVERCRIVNCAGRNWRRRGAPGA